MHNKSILLIHPPVTKPCEPPAGLAKLSGSLRPHGVDCRVYDANIDGILGLMSQPLKARDRWTRRAEKNRRANCRALRAMDLYGNPDRYKRAVMDINRVISQAGQAHDTSISLANFTSPALSPVRSADLVRAAEKPESNPFYETFSNGLRATFQGWEPDLIGLSINYLSQALCAFAMIGFIKHHLPRVRLVCGGGLVTSWMMIPDLINPFEGLVDELIGGPGENRLIELCTGKKCTFRLVTGYDFSGFDMNRYLAPFSVLPYAASRGCYWKKCAFCPEKAEDQPYQTAGASMIGEDLERIVSRTSAGLVHFLDNALSPRFMGHLHTLSFQVPWYGFARFSRHLADRDFVAALKASGCVMLKLGVESGDQKVLDAMDKGIDIQLVSRALATIHRAGIATYVYLLFGTPAESEASARKTLEFTVAHAKDIDYLNVAIFNLPAYGEDAKKLTTDTFYSGDLSLYRNFVHPMGWHRDRVRRFLAKEFKKPAAVRAILANDPPFFTSNHAPFFHI